MSWVRLRQPDRLGDLAGFDLDEVRQGVESGIDEARQHGDNDQEAEETRQSLVGPTIAARKAIIASLVVEQVGLRPLPLRLGESQVPTPGAPASFQVAGRFIQMAGSDPIRAVDPDTDVATLSEWALMAWP